MIEVNLIPDVKLELLKARRQQKMVISASILIAIASVAVLVMMCIYLFGVQSLSDNLASDDIEKKSKELKSVDGLGEMLTIQEQLGKLKTIQSEKSISSRLFDVLLVVTPTDKNKVDILSVNLDDEAKTIEIEAQAENGYEAMEVFKKTLEQTKFQYSQDGEAKDPVKIASEISEGERQYGEDSDGKRILRFTITFTYDDILFDSSVTDGKVIGPNSQRATDSVQGIPNTLFGAGGSR